MGKIGSGYIGTDSLKVSVGNDQLVPTPPSSYPYSKYSFYKFSFNNQQDCTVIINNTTTIFIPAEQGFEMDSDDLGITSFVIKESGVTYTFVAAY